MKKIIYCKDCVIKLSKWAESNNTIRCRSCANTGINNPYYKDGKRSKDFHNYCECGKEIKSKSKRCVECNYKFHQGINATHYINGKTHNKECINCGKHVAYTNNRCRECWCEELSKMRVGKNNPAYVHGESCSLYSPEFTEQLKKEIRDRDNHTCQICHKTEIELDEILAVHHIDYNKENCLKENLISLCNSCHSKTNFNRDFWFEYFKKSDTIEVPLQIVL
jgi:hypothetical protein